MKIKQYDVIVIGGGAVGSAATYAAAKEGMSVLCLEQFEALHTHGSSHEESRLFRQAYYESPDYIPLLKDAYQYWQALEKQSGETLYEESGLVLLTEKDNDFERKITESAALHHISLNYLSHTELAIKHPEFFIPEDMKILYEQRAGVLYPEACINMFMQLAKTLGANFQFQEAVRDWHVNQNDQVVVKTDQAEYQAKYCVIVGGAWAGTLLSDLQLPLQVVAKNLLWFKATEEFLSHQHNIPVFAYDLSDGFFYGFPELKGLVKVARHSGGEPLDNPLDTADCNTESERDAILEFATTFLSSIVDQPVKETTCLYTVTPDQQFILDRHPKYSNITFCAGLSGHGFKMSNVLGQCLIDLLASNTHYDLDFLSCQRF